jgi:hypothetical protein
VSLIFIHNFFKGLRGKPLSGRETKVQDTQVSADDLVRTQSTYLDRPRRDPVSLSEEMHFLTFMFAMYRNRYVAPVPANISATLLCPFCFAIESGVCPSASTKLGLAFLSNNNFTMSSLISTRQHEPFTR